MNGQEQRARQVFGEVLERPAAERAAFLAGACGDDAALRQQVEHLCRDHAVIEAAVPETASGGERAGDRIGAYKLLERIGEGGFGTVWMAEQQQPVRRKVALKILKWGMDTRQVVARFEAERQALALMDHEHIAKVFDGGATETGRPYFVMELVRGMPITQYCDEAKLSPRERLALFVPVCEAVQHAHQKGVIHRDLKPNNVLVTLHDGKPVPKVIDFGIAKATAGQLTDKTVFTGFRQMLGTPEYMAPEQAEMSGLDVDTRADIYSLGVVLYELLTGSKPFELKDVLEAGWAELLRRIREVDPEKPSTRVSTLGVRITEIAMRRRMLPKGLSSAFRGDLDWIVVKAMEKERSRRYETAHALAEDLERHLRDEPVLASPPSRMYRLRKYVRRHRVGVVAGVLGGAALLVGLFGSLYGMQVAVVAQKKEVEQRHLAEAAAVQVRAEAERSFLVARYLGWMLTGVSPRIARGRDTTLLREMIGEAAAAILRGELADSPAAELDLRVVLGNTYRELWAIDEAQRLLDPALELAHKVYPADHESVSYCLRVVGLLLVARGRDQDAERLLRESLAMRRRLYCGDEAAIADSLVDLAQLLAIRGESGEAEPMFRESLAMAQRLFPGDHIIVVQGLNCLGSLLRSCGRLEEAEQLHCDALAMGLRLYPGDYVQTANSQSFLASLLLSRGCLEEAEQQLSASLAMRQRLSRGDDDAAVANSLSLIGTLRRCQGRLAEAEPLLRDSLAMRQRLFHGDGMEVAMSLRSMAMLLEARGQLQEAEGMLRDSLAMCRRLSPGDHPDIAECLDRLGWLLLHCERLAEAEPMLRDSLAMRQRLFRGDHPDVAEARRSLGSLLSFRGDLENAEPLLRDALAMQQRLFRGDHLDVAGSLRDLGALLQSRGRVEEAELMLRDSLAMTQRLVGGDHPQVASVLHQLGILFDGRGALEEAESFARQTLAMCQRFFPQDSVRVATCFRNLAMTLDRRGKPAEAEPLVREALARIRRCPEGGRATLAACLVSLARMLQDRGDETAAEPLFREAMVLWAEGVRSSQPDEPAVSRQRLAVILEHQGRYAEAEELLRVALADLERLCGEEHPNNTMRCRLTLVSVLRKQHKVEEAESLAQKQLTLQLRHPESAKEVASAQAGLGQVLLLRSKFAEAESVLRDCLVIRAAQMPGTFLHYNAMALLGRALQGQDKLAEAEPLLVEACTRMQPTVAQRSLLREALAALIALQEQQDRSAAAAPWRERLATIEAEMQAKAGSGDAARK